jgi:hypothetical protein
VGAEEIDLNLAPRAETFAYQAHHLTGSGVARY